jgi:2-polyprenyl-3-methyl-5-hydroxy-6-metoxy-1,4-benzoquinol methylase
VNLRLWWQRFKTRRKMNRVFARGADPYDYAHKPYELARLAAMEAALGGRRYKNALEVGCAEGIFTERLSAAADLVIALDISKVALDRARARCQGRPVSFVESDLRDWAPDARTFDVVVLGDVLYYLDKPGVKDVFEATFPRLAGWLSPGARLILAHGFAGAEEFAHRQSFRKRFEAEGLKLVNERVVEADGSGGVACLLSVLDRA